MKDITIYTNNIKWRLDWSNKGLILSKIDNLKEDDKFYLKNILKREEYLGNGINLVEKLFPLIAGELKSSPRIVFCGRRNEYNRSGLCGKWKFCETCAEITKQKALGAYFPSFHFHSFYSLTISFDGGMDLTSKDSFVKVINHWNSIKDTLDSLIDDGYISGIYYGEEMYINQLNSLKINPHVHCVLHLDDYSLLDTELIYYYISQHGEGLAGEVSVVLKRIDSESYFFHALQYPTKPIDFLEKYKISIHQHKSNPAVIQKINRDLSWFLNLWIEAARGRHTIKKLGTMHPASARYIGTRGKQKKQDSIEYIKIYREEELRKRLDFKGALRDYWVS